MAKVELKAPIIEEIKANVENAKSIILVDYRGLTVEQDTALRKAFRENGVVYKVYKNTYLKMAFAGTQYEVLSDKLDGPTAVAFAMESETVAAKIVVDTKKKADAIEFKAGVVGGELYDPKGLEVIATIPSRDELISKLLGSLQSPIANIARVLKQIADAKENPAA